MNTAKAMLPSDLAEKGPMPLSKVTGFLKQFPCVQQFVKGNVQQAYVSRIDEEVLLIVPKPYHDFVFGEHHEEVAFLLDEHGKLVMGAVKGTRKKYYVLGEPVPHISIVQGVARNSSILHVLKEIGEAEKSVRFILFYSEKNGSDMVILYKSPKGISILDWVAQQVANEAEQYQKQIDSIDAEAA